MTLGDTLKRIRTNGLIRVRDLARQVGVSPSMIYQIEQDKVAPSYSTLSRLARALGTTVPVLLGGETPENWLLVRKSDRLKLVTGEDGALLEVVPFLGFRSKRMQVLAFELQPGAVHRQVVFSHDREDLLCLETGEVEVELGGRRLRMAAGDIAHLVLDRPRSIRNPGAETARGIWVVSPPASEDMTARDTGE